MRGVAGARCLSRAGCRFFGRFGRFDACVALAVAERVFHAFCRPCFLLLSQFGFEIAFKVVPIWSQRASNMSPRLLCKFAFGLHPKFNLGGAWEALWVQFERNPRRLFRRQSGERESGEHPRGNS